MPGPDRRLYPGTRPPNPLPQGEGENNVPPSRAATLGRALLPGGALDDWSRDGPVAIDGLLRLAPADQQEEAAAIALVLRQALETTGARAALVTPDRDLAGRVATELARYGVDRRRQRGRKTGRDAAGGVPAPAGGGGGRTACAGAAAGGAEASAGRRRPGAGCLPRRRARAGDRRAARPAPRPGLSGLRQRLDTAREAGARGGGPPDSAADRADLRAAAALLARVETLSGAGLAQRRRGRSRAGRDAGRADRGGRAPRRHRRHARPVAAVGRRGGRGAGHRAGRRAGRAAGAAGPAARRAARPARRGAGGRGGAHPPGAARRRPAPSIRACSSGACWRRGCNRPS